MWCTKCLLAKGVVHQSIPRDPAARPASSLAERQTLAAKQAIDLARRDREELENFRRAACQPGGGPRGSEGPRQGKGKSSGRTRKAGDGLGQPGMAPCPELARAGPRLGSADSSLERQPVAEDRALSAASKLILQGEAQELWRKLQEFQQLGVVEIAAGSATAIQFPALPPAESDLPWEGRLQRAKNCHNRAWGKFKSAKQKEVEAAKRSADLSLALEEAREAEVAARLAAELASKAFDEAGVQMHLVEDEQRGPKAGEDESDDDMAGQPKLSAGRPSRQPARKPAIPADETEIWDSFKGQLAESVLAAVQGGTVVPDITGSVQILAGKLAALMESKARGAYPFEPQVPSAPAGPELGQPGFGVSGACQDDQKGQPMGTGRGAAGARGRAISRSRSRGGESDGPL